ncbi:hypothetical protein DM02DRAFT_657753 [Periconia macrospinosa]|uniref:PiggyBac transposable element-derived protein domain-containing protein n=1 Tax=Periconia macrospinosa TaxID=97972 RepID=A0A2V1DIJ0_9PLEO|nr:hypothetical protein DM02DRAFT_657753 [Periconia macrospinosa]
MPRAVGPPSNDTDFVKYTKYSKKAGVLPNLPREPPPDWRPLKIDNPRIFGDAQIPDGVDKGSPIALFDLFFDADVLDRIAYYTNQHAEHVRADSPSTCRGWKPTSPTELYTYFAIVIYMGLHREPSLSEYWVKLHGSAPTQNQSFKSPFGRVWDLSESLRERTFKYWTAGKHLCVDEAIARFTRRASEIVCLANDGVILNWLFHARGAGRGPVNLLTVTEATFTPTESVPITLVLGKDSNGDRLFPPNLHIVWDDNLFNTIPMLEYLRSKGVGCADTVRTTKTATEERFEAEAEAELQSEVPAVARRARSKLTKERFNSDLVKLKTQFTGKLEWGATYWALSESKEVLEAAWRDNQVVLFASTVVEPVQLVQKLRRRSKLSQNNQKLFKSAFGDESVKLLGMPKMIDDYNKHKSEVDRFDQTRSYYSVQQVKRRTWKPLWYFLLDLTINNCYRLSSYSSSTAAKRGGHKKFLYDLIEQLFKRGKRLCHGSTKRQRLDDLAQHVSVNEEGSHRSVRLFGEARTCAACAENGRTKYKSLRSRPEYLSFRDQDRSTSSNSQLCEAWQERHEFTLATPKCDIHDTITRFN